MTDFEKATGEYIDAIREHALAHVEAMQSVDEAINRRYQEACERVEEAGRSWRAFWSPGKQR
jgi:hypothetical protein